MKFNKYLCNYQIALFHFFPKRWAAHTRTKPISLSVRTTNCWMYSNISQILLLNKTWGYYNTFDSTKSLDMLLTCQNTTIRVYGTWIRIYCILCLKAYGTFSGLFWCAAGSWLPVRSARICESRLLYYPGNCIQMPIVIWHIRLHFAWRYCGRTPLPLSKLFLLYWSDSLLQLALLFRCYGLVYY